MDKIRRAMGNRSLLIVVGMLALFAVNAFLANVLVSSVVKGFLAREGEVTQEFLNSILAAEGTAKDLFAPPAPSEALKSFATHVRSLPGIVRANIYSPDGFIRHSTDANLIGLHFGDNDELAEAFAGKVAAALEEVHASDKSEHLALAQMQGEKLVEAYIPVQGADKKVVAVVEFYRRDIWIQRMEGFIRTSLLVASAVNSVIFAIALLFATRRRKE